MCEAGGCIHGVAQEKLKTWAPTLRDLNDLDADVVFALRILDQTPVMCVPCEMRLTTCYTISVMFSCNISACLSGRRRSGLYTYTRTPDGDSDSFTLSANHDVLPASVSPSGEPGTPSTSSPYSFTGG